NELAAEIYFMASRDNLAHSQPAKAYANALSAVRLRTGQVRYWQLLSTSKFVLRQYESLLEDQPALQSLGEGLLDEKDLMRFAFARFFLAQYDETVALATQLIKENRSYPAPYVLLARTYTAEKRYTDAERTLLNVLQMYPSQEEAVESLAHL